MALGDRAPSGVQVAADRDEVRIDSSELPSVALS
jgi:hypothetical protein